MKLKNSFFYTIRENIKDEDSISGNLLVKSGMIKKTSSGVYMYMPLGYKVLKNIEKIVRDEMNFAGASEVLMPSLLNEEYFEKSGRLNSFGKSMFSLEDRFGKKYALGPTHEELFTFAALSKVKSFKDLPFTLFQIQNKFRDEKRPRYGLIRVREFLMKDAYSFDRDEKGLDESYNKMYNAYKKIFGRLKIEYKIVKADTGAMGGILSEEFQGLTDIGEDTVVYCETCDYSSNIEICESMINQEEAKEKPFEKDLVDTGDAKTIAEVAEFLPEAESKLIKTLIYTVDNKEYAFLVKGDSEVNETKILKLLNASEISLTDADKLKKQGLPVGNIGPIDLNIPIIVDNEVSIMVNFVVGANKKGYHYKNVNMSDFESYLIADIRNVKEGDICPNCGNKLLFKKGIEIGNTFKLGTKYSENYGLNYTTKENKVETVFMGCYGIGIGRCMATIVEQNNDENGIIWPMNVAPYKVAIVVIDIYDDEQMEAAEHLYNELQEAKIDCILDDRDERAGVKFKDMDLIGIPIRITIGKKIVDHIVEIKKRNEEEIKEISIFDSLYKVEDIIAEQKV